MPSGKNTLLLLSLLLLLVLPLSVGAQSIKSFSTDSTQFSREIQEYFGKMKNPDNGMRIRDIMQPFCELWDSGYYSPAEKSIIISNANLLMKRRFPAYPDMYNYFLILYNLKTRANKDALYLWCDDFSKRYPEMSQRKTQAYLKQFKLLTAENILYESNTFSWFCSDTSLLLRYDTTFHAVFQGTVLICATKNDTAKIFNTSGIYTPDDYTWIGQKGRVTWERVKLSPDTVYADLRDYRIDLNRSEYHADTVTLINSKYFKEPLYGELTDKVMSSPPGPGTAYPRFNSYLKTYEIHNLFKNIDYRGGLTVEGARIIGSGVADENAVLNISSNGKLRAQVRSNGFRILGDKISSNPASISVFTDNDSIYHPGLQMNYFDDKRQLVMYTERSGLSQSPFFNGYHAIDMDCGAMYWNLDSDTIDFESVPGINRTSINEFISNNYFSKFEFYKLQGMDERNPLFIIRDFARDYGTREVTPELLAQYMKKPVEQIKAMLLKLSIQGFLYYDLVNDKAIIQDRLYRYIQDNAGKRDYDVIRIHSTTNNISNARLNLDNYDLLIRGVNEVLVSDSQQVYIFPENEEITLKRGLDFVFSGNVSAGLFDFYAHDCSFEYDSFKLNIPLIDSLSFKVKSFTQDERGEYQLRRVASVIENLSGRILIDHPTNKSGLKAFPSYPIFESEQESFVYYDRDPLYQRDRFAYHVYPFTLDSLDNFSTDNLSFDGYLVSAGIFPDIDQPLKVQPDYSLGFVNMTPKEGYPAYGGKGEFFDEVDLSNRGLRGKGDLTYLTSLTKSDDFHFYPDTMISEMTHNITIQPQIAEVEYPSVAGDSLYISWYPYLDTMHLRTIQLPLRMFDDKALLYGDLYYSPNGLSGKGKVGFESVELNSEKYVFRNRTVDADTLDFKLFAEGTDDLVVSAEKYRTHVDFDSRTVQFRTNKKGSTVSFPYNDFVCFMDNIDWFMDKHEMKLYNDLGEKYANIDNMSRQQLLKLDLSGSDFLATNPEADSLTFFSVTATYDLNNYIIDAENVKLIRVADAAIFPDSSFVKIDRGGRIQTLRNAGIIADTAHQYHTIENADINILARRNYHGKGIYQYHDSTNVVQEIRMDTISVDTAGRTIASGKIPENQKFELNSYFDFKGNASMLSARKGLFFEGGFQTRDDCFRAYKKNWVYFKSWIDPDDVRIPVEQPLVDLDGNNLDLGLLISDYEEDIYASWFTPRVMLHDTNLVAPSGVVYFDEKADGYRIVKPEEKTQVMNQAGYFYNTRSCSMEYSGPLNLGLSFNYVDMVNYGNVRYWVIPDSAQFNLTLAFDFLFYEPDLNTMADSILATDKLKGLDVTRKDYQDFLDYEMGVEDAKDLKDDITLYGNIRRLPDKMVHTFILTDVNMYWNSYTNSYISRGPIGVMSIGKNPVNRYMNGYLELIRRRSGDVISLYLEVTPLQYYFFDYRNGILQTISSDNTYNARLETLKQEKRVMSKPGLEETYEFTVSTRRKLIDFLRRMQP